MDENNVIEELKEQEIDLVCSIPCDKARGLFFRLPEEFRHIGLTREEDGVGISAGVSLAGARPLVALQSSGLGNMLNAILSLSTTFGLPLPILASWRGGDDEVIPAQVPFNRPLPAILSAAGIPHTILSGHSTPHRIGDAIVAAFRANTPHVILVPPGLIEERECLPASPGPGITPCHPVKIAYTREWKRPVMTRFDAIETIAARVTDEVLVSNIGVPSKELYAAKDRPENFYMLGSYTQASAIGLGIATVRPDKRVIVIDGDGSLLGSSILPVIAATAPKNLTVIGLDNGVFGSTGNQPRPGCETADLRLLAMGAGFEHTWTVHDPGELESALAASAHGGPAFIHARIMPGNSNVPNIPLSPQQIRDRFMNALIDGSPGNR
ncbi:MAG: sulfopyruvate decarboxylase subunit beta [Methanoregula sp.]|uniref:sulfopyruvate decarboxylase subunit beta n=1 Tax=Methanoregula sp. TaxID=2052170 RepID=UPI0025F764A7|nr:sulfopyruvate decarboxylase subunit beta [Methanoregula sp.]MCK9630456.1 sulfopyruvate decarboxylase subunit beta [Methanoregula sp.]